MAKVKVCLNTGCTKYILLDDGRTIETPLTECKPTKWGDKQNKEWQSIVEQTREAIKVNRPAFRNIKVGDEVNI